MDIPTLSMYQTQNQIQNAVGIAVLSNAMDQSKAQGAMMASMIASVPTGAMELSVNPDVGGSFDMRI